MKIFTGIILVLILFFSLQQKGEKIERMYPGSFAAQVANTKTIEAGIKDTIPDKTIVIYEDENGYPIKYSRKLITGVCIDGKCRLLKINLYWNVTGRYLGFKLPAGEFLSKTEHDPFSSFEYDRLHELLAEANSPLASYTLEELVPTKDSSGVEVDAVTSATIDAVLDYIVEGAVYTTYTLWNIVYGPTKKEIEKLTTEKLDAKLCLLILNSNYIKDQVWVLNHIPAEMAISEELQTKFMELISGNDVYLAERTLNAIKPAAISNEIQIKLAKIFQNSGFLQKRLIIQKYKEIDNLQPEVVQILSSELNNLNGTLTKNILELYNIQDISDSYTISEVARLLKNKNRFISNQAFNYLNSVSNLDKKTQKMLKKHIKSNS